MFLLSWVLAGCYVLLLAPYLLMPDIRLNEIGQLRTISGMIVQDKIAPFGHLLLSLGNLLLFEIMTLESAHREMAWVFWFALQAVLSWDVDKHHTWHFFWLLVYIVMLLVFWGHVCVTHGMWTEASPLWVFTIAFALWWMREYVNSRQGEDRPRINIPMVENFPLQPIKANQEFWGNHTIKSLLELAWMASVIAVTGFYEYKMRSDLALKSDSYNL